MPVLEEAPEFNPTRENLVLGAEKIEIARSLLIVNVQLERRKEEYISSRGIN